MKPHSIFRKNFISIAIRAGLFLLLLLLLSNSPINAQQIIKLKDQTIIRGKIIEMTNGIFRVNTISMGEVKIPAEQVLAILTENAAALPIHEGNQSRSSPSTAKNDPRQSNFKRPQSSILNQSSAPSSITPSTSSSSSIPSGSVGQLQQQINTSVQSMLMNSEFFDKITNLQNGQEMQDVLNDPEIMNAIQNGDYQFLMNNEKMQRLMNSQDIKEILDFMR